MIGVCYRFLPIVWMDVTPKVKLNNAIRLIACEGYAYFIQDQCLYCIVITNQVKSKTDVWLQRNEAQPGNSLTIGLTIIMLLTGKDNCNTTAVSRPI
jgi:hypothetical protein